VCEVYAEPDLGILMDALALVSAGGQPDTRASQQSNDSNMASSAQLHKQLLAAEVAKV